MLTVTASGVSFSVEKEIMIRCKTVENLLLDSRGEDVPLPSTDPKMVKYVIEFIKKEKTKVENMENEEDVDEKFQEYDTTLWHCKFFSSMNRGDLIHLLQVVNYLDYPPMLNALCKYINFLLSGKSPAEVYTEFQNN